MLLETCKQPMWSSYDYQEDSHNCYAFVLMFLQSLGFGGLSKTALNR